METHTSKPMHLNLAVKANLIARFLKLIERGFKLKIKGGLSIRELFCVHLDISDNYFENRIQTIFLDGMPVDNVDATWVDDGSRIALSAAMPGLVGATFRKDGVYASFRGTISYTKEKKTPIRGEATINLKFFNLIAKELGPVFLQKGVWINGRQIQDFISMYSNELEKQCVEATLNNKKISIEALFKANWEGEAIFLQVTSEEES